MKRRLLAIVFATLMLCTMLSFSILTNAGIIPDENETENFPWGDAQPGPTYTPGDINGDGELDTIDVTALLQYHANIDVEVVEDALDVNGDGELDTIDITVLLQYHANYDVELH